MSPTDMAEPPAPDTAPDAFTDLATQTARIPWRELQRFFAAGQTIAVAPGTDLVATAEQVMADDADAMRALIDAGQVAAVSDEQARDWIAADAEVWAVVVKPWVLVQDAAPSTDEVSP